MNVFIIAEAGVNHNGDVHIAKGLIDAAVEAGADAVKFQTFRAEKIVTKTSKKADYQVRNTGLDESQFSMLRKLELSESAHRDLFTYCAERDIMFMSTPFDEGSADFLDGLGMSIFKIPSGEITDKPLIVHIAAKKKPVILSTGMSYVEEVEKAVGWITGVWGDKQNSPRLTLLHCVSNYPADTADVNLLAMTTMKERLGFPVGFSDHTMGTDVTAAAVALGASVIEKHFTLDRTMEGPDHKASLEPAELRQMVKAIRNIEKALGDGIKRPAASEGPLREIARKSLVAARPVDAGAVITFNDIAVKRPGTGIPPEFMETVIGKKAVRNIEEDTLIVWEDLKDA